MTVVSKRSVSDYSPGQRPGEPVGSAVASRTPIEPPGSGNLDDEGFITMPGGRPVVPIQTPEGPRHPMQVPVRNPMTPRTQVPIEEIADADEPEIVVVVVPEDVLFEAAAAALIDAPRGPTLNDATPSVEFMPDVPDNPVTARAPDDPIYQVCYRCGMPYGTFIDDPFTGKLVHRYTTACSANMSNPNPFPEVTTRVEVLHLPA